MNRLKENCRIDRQKGLNPDRIREAGSSTGIPQYVYTRLDFGFSLKPGPV